MYLAAFFCIPALKCRFRVHSTSTLALLTGLSFAPLSCLCPSLQKRAHLLTPASARPRQPGERGRGTWFGDKVLTLTVTDLTATSGQALKPSALKFSRDKWVLCAHSALSTGWFGEDNEADEHSRCVVLISGIL